MRVRAWTGRGWLWCVGLALGLVGSASADDRDWNVVLNGKAIHIGAKQEWNEKNWGLGLEREFDRYSPWVKVVLANGFVDSNEEMSYMAGGGIKRRFRPLANHRDLYFDGGVVGFLMTRHDVRDNEPFPGLLPALTLGTSRFALNFSYVPGRFVTKTTDVRAEDSGIKGVMFLQIKLALPEAGGRSAERGRGGELESRARSQPRLRRKDQ